MPEDPDWESFLIDIMAVTSWTMEQILQHTYPQLRIIHTNRGRLIFPHVKPSLEYLFGQSFMDDKSIDGYVRKMETRYRNALNPNAPPIRPTAAEAKRKRGWDFFVAEYLGAPDINAPDQARPKVMALPLSPVGASAILEWLKEDEGNACPTDVWIKYVMPLVPSIEVIAAGG